MKVLIFGIVIICVCALKVFGNAYVARMQCRSMSAASELSVDEIKDLCK